jgi:dihydrofolate reductase
MGKIFLFMNMSLDGYVEDSNQDILAFQVRDSKFEAFQRDQGRDTGAILLGRKTFEIMRNFWPTPMAQQIAPDVAKFMNDTPKTVVSHNNLEPNWQNTTVIYDDIANKLAKLKVASSNNIIVMGSNNLCVTLIQEGLLDEVQIVVNPVLLGGGTPLFDGIAGASELLLKETISFESGKVLLAYEFTGT